MNICFETFGCRLSRSEALEDEARCLARGHKRVESHADADLIVVRGCSVTSHSQHEAERLVRHLRGKYPFKRVVVTGCLPNAKPLVITKDEAEVEDALPTRTARAYLKAQDGCDGACTFCIVPQFRGAAVSVPFDRVVERARRFIDAGYHEIVLTGCNLSAYVDGARRLPQLVDALAALSPACRLRLGSVEPVAAAADTLRAMGSHANVCRFVHLPIQSGSERILQQMKRPYTAKIAEELAELAVELMPGLGLGCDLMAGFPGESEADLAATLALIKRLPFNNSHVFPYSERPGTAAVRLGNSVDLEERSERAGKLAHVISEKRRDFAKRQVGHTVEVLVEGHHHLCGWTSEYLWVEAHRNRHGMALSRVETHRKELRRFRIDTTEGFILKGEMLPDDGR